MKAQELRIGNYVKSGNQNCYINFFLGRDMADLEVIGFEYTDDNHEEFISKLQPITLTEEWLVKFGFVDYSCHVNYYEKCIKSDIPSKHVVVRFGRQRNYFTFFNHSECNFTDMQFLRELEYVHQLQNLYFALTGDELTLKTEL